LKIPQYLACDIVESMKKIINQDINYIDTDGMIIASTNKNRVGTFHGGAKRVLTTKSELIISFDDQYEGTKQGINLPVFFQNDIVGVIGITGSEEQVGKYGKIIKQMTEILVKEAFLAEQEKTARENIKQFVEELLFLTHKDNEKTVEMRSELLNIKIDIPRIVLVARIIDIYDHNSLSMPSSNEKIYNLIKSYIDFNVQNIIVQSGMNCIIILDLKAIKDMSSFIYAIHENIERKYSIKICFGIGNSSTNANEMRRSYMEAKKALDVALASRKKFIMKYSELDIDLLIDEISDVTKKIYIDKVFNNIEFHEINSYLEILTKYFENNGSISKIADELFIHKNTLQYKLNKIKKLTGYDPRNINDMVVLYLAVMLYDSNK